MQQSIILLLTVLLISGIITGIINYKADRLTPIVAQFRRLVLSQHYTIIHFLVGYYSSIYEELQRMNMNAKSTRDYLVDKRAHAGICDAIDFHFGTHRANSCYSWIKHHSNYVGARKLYWYYTATDPSHRMSPLVNIDAIKYRLDRLRFIQSCIPKY